MAGRGIAASSPLDPPAPKIGDDFTRGIMARRTGHAPAGMRAGSAHIESLQGSAIVAVSHHRPRREHLVQAERTMKDIAADQAEGPLEIERAHDLPSQHRGLEIRRMT